MINLTIDGRQTSVPEGTLVLHAARELGIDIPTFCHHARLLPFGACRMCLVEIEKAPKLQTACTTVVSEGMVVRTDTEQVRLTRQSVLEFLLANHPLDCPVCDKGGECELQDLTHRWGAPASQFREAKNRKGKALPFGPFIVMDEERCILCQRCVRFDQEVLGEGGIGLMGRGFRTRVGTFQGRPYDTPFSGNVVDLCPVGALTSRPYRFRARPWDLTSVASTCLHCSVGCAARLDARENHWVRLRGADDPAVNQGWLCDRGRYGFGFAASPERLTAPQLRRGGKLAATSWEEALDRVVQALREAGPDRVGIIGGGRLTDQEAALLHHLGRQVLGTAHLDRRAGRQLTATPHLAGGTLEDLDRAAHIVLIGCDPEETAPVLALRVRQALRRGTPVTELGPWQTYGPGHAWIPPSRWLPAVGSTATALAGLREELAEQDQPVVLVWSGEDAAVHDELARWRQAMPGARLLIVGDQPNARGAEAAGLLPGSGGRSTPELLAAAAAGDLQVLYLVGVNPALSFPDGALVREALEKVPFLVVQDLFATESARSAHALLPVAAWSEKTGSWSNLEGRHRPLAALTPAPENLPDDGGIFRELIRRLGGEVSAPLPAPAPPAAAAAYPLSTPPAAEGLRVATVELTYSGGGTVLHAPALSPVLPEAWVTLHPEEAARRDLAPGQVVELSCGDSRLTLSVRTSAQVAPGLALVPRRLPHSPDNLLTEGAAVALTPVPRKEVLP